MSRPLIGVTTSTRFTPSWPFLALSVALAGGRPRRITARTPALDYDDIDGLLIGGGADLSAELYGGKTMLNTRVEPERDELELALLKKWWATDLPILGVCRGSQVMNVFCGGRLHADIHAVYVEAPKMRTILPRKRVTIEPSSELSEIVEADRLEVNCLHHQSVDRLGDGLAVSARDEHGIVQAIEAKGPRFRIGVQWHPEFLIYKRAHRRLFHTLVRSAEAARSAQTRASASVAA